MNSFNIRMIEEHIEEYKRLELDKNWYSYLRWLSNITVANSFGNKEIELVKKYLG